MNLQETEFAVPLGCEEFSNNSICN